MNKKRQINAIKYTCIYCGKERMFSLEKYIVHLEMFHNEISKTNQNEMIKDLSHKIYSIDKKERKRIARNTTKREILKKDTPKQSSKIKRKEELKSYKEKILTILENTEINQTQIETIKLMKYIKRLKRYISNLNEEIKIHLDNEGIDYSVKETNKNKKKKFKSLNFYDETKHSVKVIYTPMGNKR